MLTPTLLGYLAKFGSFSNQSELLCTQGLTYLFQTYKEARSAMADEVDTRTGIGISDSLTWLAEAQQADEARPDLEARSADGVPVVKVEAKLGAELGTGQLQSYVADLLERNSGQSVMLVLVPKGRTAESAQVTITAFGPSESGLWQVTDTRFTGTALISVMSWDELFTSLRAGKGERFLLELEQLQTMYHVLIGDFIAPVTSNEEVLRWRERETDFLNVVDQVTRRLTTKHQLYPMGSERLKETSHEGVAEVYRRRYVSSFDGDVESSFSIGLRDPFAGYETPIWMRFHWNTGRFGNIRQRIEASTTLDSLESGGHIWVPLEVPREVPGEQMIQDLIEQAEQVICVAYQA
jgi:hypothetical protein